MAPYEHRGKDDAGRCARRRDAVSCLSWPGLCFPLVRVIAPKALREST